MGVILAWVLVRYEFSGKRIMNGIIELPFALPTAVAGIALTHLTTTNGLVGAFFYNKFGIEIAYTKLGITVALIFIGIPFVVRSVQPVLEKIDLQYEEAAHHARSQYETDRVPGDFTRDCPGASGGIYDVLCERARRIRKRGVHCG